MAVLFSTPWHFVHPRSRGVFVCDTKRAELAVGEKRKQHVVGTAHIAATWYVRVTRNTLLEKRMLLSAADAMMMMMLVVVVAMISVFLLQLLRLAALQVALLKPPYFVFGESRGRFVSHRSLLGQTYSSVSILGMQRPELVDLESWSAQTALTHLRQHNLSQTAKRSVLAFARSALWQAERFFFKQFLLLAFSMLSYSFRISNAVYASLGLSFSCLGTFSPSWSGMLWPPRQIENGKKGQIWCVISAILCVVQLASSSNEHGALFEELTFWGRKCCTKPSAPPFRHYTLTGSHRSHGRREVARGEGWGRGPHPIATCLAQTFSGVFSQVLFQLFQSIFSIHQFLKGFGSVRQQTWLCFWNVFEFILGSWFL